MSQREIKFRAWDKVKKIMIRSAGFTDSDCGRIWIRERCMVDDGSNGESWNDWIPMQYIGLKDKNGKEIYEGDIILKTWNNCKEVVTWDEYNTGWLPFSENNYDRDFYFVRDNLKSCEVIGNIYENPELL